MDDSGGGRRAWNATAALANGTRAAAEDYDICRTSPFSTSFLIVAYCTVMTLGLSGNACLVFVVARQRDMRNITNVFIANLSVSDILVVLLCLPLTLVYTLMDHWAFGELLCKLSPFVQCTSVTVSVLSLVLISLERHQLILHPTGWKPSLHHAYAAIAVVWAAAALASLPFATFHVLTDEPLGNLSGGGGGGDADPLEGKHVCVEVWPSSSARLLYTTALLALQYCVPLAFILGCYARIFLRLRRRRGMLERPSLCREAREASTGHYEHRHDHLQQESYSRRARQARRINGMLATIVAAFALCWLPLNVFNALYDWHHQAVMGCHHDLVFSLCHLTAMASTCVNPVCYGLLNTNFQKELKAMAQRCWCMAATGLARVSDGGSGGGGGSGGRSEVAREAGAGRADEEAFEHFPLSTMTTDMSKDSIKQHCRTNSM
ncbi:neuropeptide Y receptor type 1-like [Petromyzon marinus]|uniref:Neuropeptide Y receptor type 1-like n=1 Tax=Petromyzon marinus TaxID=7757 RepID=A0AAJ7X8I9_PETMA|nr:neuropeptide Y receptor type 1-like [Petromyzon marinus]